MATVVLTVPRLLHCDPCEDTVAEVLTALAGVQLVWADTRASSVRVDFDSARVDIGAMRAALARAAFDTVETGNKPAAPSA